MTNHLPTALQTAREHAETLEAWLRKCHELMQAKADTGADRMHAQVLETMSTKAKEMAAQLEAYEDRYTNAR